MTTPFIPPFEKRPDCTGLTRWVIVFSLLCALLPNIVFAQGRGLLPADKIKQSADGVLAMMSFSVVPDLTSSFLSIKDDQVGQNRLFYVPIRRW